MRIYCAHYEGYEGTNIVLITENFEQAKASFTKEFDWLRENRKLISVWENGKCVDTRNYPFEEEP